MKKKTICIGIISMFLLTSITSLSAMGSMLNNEAGDNNLFTIDITHSGFGTDDVSFSSPHPSLNPFPGDDDVVYNFLPGGVTFDSDGNILSAVLHQKLLSEK